MQCLLAVCGIFLFCLYTGTHALEEGDTCKFQKEPGVCLGYSKCRQVLESLEARITICTYNAQEAVVCCPSNYQDHLVKLRNEEAGLRISAKKCKDYARLAMPTQILSWLKPDTQLIQKRGNLCTTDNKLIVGGEAAQPGEFPHMVAIGYRRQHFTSGIDFNCGGSLISENFVLTAGHCRTRDAFMVRLGSTELFGIAGDEPASDDYYIESFIKHPSYTIRNKYNDIALIKLMGMVRMSQRIRPACLYQSTEVTEPKLIAIGYGALQSFGVSANRLMKVVLDQYNNEQCQQVYQDLASQPSLAQGIHGSQLCAGYASGGHDTCQGDSGGPLQVRDKNEDCIFQLVAITSFGKVCGTTIPGVYTRISWYLDWIESIVWPPA
ncbi:serine protease snake-like [Wyeomyia smithii]|uniref:serine protease snake-like n=1 Tax=Wyeomyia smithii TaxID=174621 RepID=UPI002467C7E5|nr:serine protease snake-like [Wyeomyia smithii]